ALAEAYESVAGWYYELSTNEKRREALQTELWKAEGKDQIYFLRLAVQGFPSRVAPFRIIPLYVMVKPDECRVRLVRSVNNRGERTGVVPLDEKSFTSPRDFRWWLARAGNFGWEKGERALQALQRDINFVLARKVVVQLVCFGCERPGSFWFLND